MYIGPLVMKIFGVGMIILKLMVVMMIAYLVVQVMIVHMASNIGLLKFFQN